MLEIRDFEAGTGEAGLCGDAGAKSNVASSPPTRAGVPQDEQNRPSRGSSVPQLLQEDMNFPAPVYRFTENVMGNTEESDFFL